MSSNGSIPPNMNPAPSGASAYEPEQTGVHHSLHHCYIWLGALRAAPIIFICGLSSLSGLMKLAEALGFVSVDAFFVAVLLLLAATVLVCGVVMGARAWTYRYIWYEFDETEFSFYSGILNKRCTHVPYSKIQSVNERASLLQRLAGVPKSDLILVCGLTGFLLLLCLTMAWVVYLVGVCLSYGGFQARRRGGRIEVERGLITHVFNGIDVDRIQSVHIHQTFFQRLMRCCSVSYGRVGVATGEESSGSSSQLETDRLVVHPFLPIAEAWGVVQGLTPEYAHAPVASTPLPKVALRRAITRRAVLKGVGFWLAVALLLLCAAAFAADATAAQGHAQLGDFAAATLIPGLLLCVAIAAIEVVGAFLWHRRSAFGFDNSGTIVVNGGYSTDTVIVPRRKMQYACLRANPLQRHAGVATVLVRTAAGVRGCDERLIDVPIAEASAWLDWAQPEGSRAV